MSMGCYYHLSQRSTNDKSVEKDKLDYWIESFRHYMLCVFYGLPLVHKDGILLSTVSVFILLTKAIYLTTLFISCRDKRYIVLKLVGVITFMVAIVLLTLFAIQSSSAKQTFVGVICVVSYFICSVRVPLSSIKTVVETKSVEHIPLRLYSLNFIGAVIWTAYSLTYIFDLYALIASGLGTLLCGSQLIAYAIYNRSTPKVKTE
ncbi:unnamed protein product [Arabis nemorensis]|uniref:Bidirectional sugar transporter SWEET n=1 Tax=Arabis nemorensis TaxID=586526 RepID=A0A565CDV8_9BRAS|nr:unnamed protein product [Arabis nemorensis]